MTKDAWMRFSDEGYRHHEVIKSSFKYKMMDLQAAIGIQQPKRIEAYGEEGQRIWQEYNRRFAELPCILPPDPQPQTRHAYRLYTQLINIKKVGGSRNWVLTALTSENIGVGAHDTPLHLHPFYRKTFDLQKGQIPNAEWIGERILSLPLSAVLNSRCVDDVCQSFCKIITA